MSLRVFQLLTLLTVLGAVAPARAQSYSNATDGLFNEVQDNRRFGFHTFSGFDSWRGVADGSYQNNNGMRSGFNLGGALPGLADRGLAWQFGSSFGLYDWNGRESPPTGEFAGSAQQSFITSGVFRRAHEYSAWSGGIVVDQMLANNFGVFSNEPYLCQVRYQWGYALNRRNELGLWGTQELNHSSQNVFFVPVTTRAVNQLNFFWRHKFDLGADGSFYAGLPTNDRVGVPGTLGNFIFGGSFNLPLNDRLAVYTSLAYLNPTSPSPNFFGGSNSAQENSFNISIGISWYPGRNARSRTVAGRTWMPYLPVANNGTFLVDQDFTF